jgi:hypothetical protein
VESGGIARKRGLVGAPECRVPDKAGQSRAEQGPACVPSQHDAGILGCKSQMRLRGMGRDMKGWGGKGWKPRKGGREPTPHVSRASSRPWPRPSSVSLETSGGG